jgi:hypothetical protein
LYIICMADIFYARVVQRMTDGTYVVKRMTSSAGRAEATLFEHGARVLSPIPTESGGGMRAVPTRYDNLYATCVKDGSICVILGFDFRGTSKRSVDVSAGGFELSMGSGSSIAGKADGSIALYADSFSSMVLDKPAQSLFAMFKNMTLRFWTGWFQAKTNDDKESYELYLSKYLDKSAMPSFASSLTPDNLRIEFGHIEGSDAIARWTVQQAFDGLTREPGLVLKGHIGNDNGVVVLYEADNKTLGTVGRVELGENGSVTYTGTHGDRSVSGVFDVDGSVPISMRTSSGDTFVSLIFSNTDPAVRLNVNDKAEVLILNDGTIKLKNVDPAKILLGGSGKELALLTEKFKTLIFDNHVHPTPAGPSSKPIPLAAPPVTTDSTSNITTFTTKAE